MPTYLSPGVYVEETSAGARPIEGVGTAVAAFVGLASAGPYNTPTLVTNWSQFTKIFGDFVEGTYLHHSVYGYFQNGGGACYIVRVGGNGASAPVARAELTAAAGGGGAAANVGAFRVQALSEGAEGNDITVEIADSAAEGAPEDAFKLIVKKGDKVEETFDNVTTKKGRQNVVNVVNAQSKLVRLEDLGVSAEKVSRGTVALAGGGVPAPTHLAPDDYVGDAADRTGFGGLEAIDEVTMVSVPDLMSAYQNGMLDAEGVKAVQLAMIAHCELMGDRMAILDPPPGLNAQQIKEWRVDKAGYDSKYAALYWPWVKVMDPATGTNVFVPPSGHMAGIWGRNDDTRGVHKAPANEVVRGAISLEINITKNEHDLLNPVGINCIRAFPGRGIRVWGARTISSDPAWRYLNVRRLFNYLEESILNGTDWVVFEPNDYSLWSKINRTISTFLVNEWRKGALFGLTPAEAFYVKCDAETNPAEGIDAGQVVCEIGVAPVKPAEFVIFRLSQFSGGAALVNE
ncbi:MAG TPA: phage tail sheath family protein [Acidimicrobiales bacterium]|nr:phage tail sheath family protein [Acidimicrobiales bacterium]